MTAVVGARAPGFDLPSDSGVRVTLDSLTADGSRWLVLYFYPKDDTPGCTREAHDFTQALPRFRRLGAVVVGVSRDTVVKHGSFRKKIGIGFPLLSDPELTAHKAYGVWGTKTMYGKKVEGTIRSTFLLSLARGGTAQIARVWSGVRVDGHVDAVLGAIEDIERGAPEGAAASKPVAKRHAAKDPVARDNAERQPPRPTKRSTATKTAASRRSRGG